MEQITLSGNEWMSESLILFKSGTRLQMTLKKNLVQAMKLEDHDIVKIYFKKIGKAKRTRKNPNDKPYQKKEKTEVTEETEPKKEMNEAEAAEMKFVELYKTTQDPKLLENADITFGTERVEELINRYVKKGAETLSTTD